MGFSKNLGWEMGIGYPLQDPLKTDRRSSLKSSSLVVFVQNKMALKTIC